MKIPKLQDLAKIVEKYIEDIDLPVRKSKMPSTAKKIDILKEMKKVRDWERIYLDSLNNSTSKVENNILEAEIIPRVELILHYGKSNSKINGYCYIENENISHLFSQWKEEMKTVDIETNRRFLYVVEKYLFNRALADTDPENTENRVNTLHLYGRRIAGVEFLKKHPEAYERLRNKQELICYRDEMDGLFYSLIESVDDQVRKKVEKAYLKFRSESKNLEQELKMWFADVLLCDGRDESEALAMLTTFSSYEDKSYCEDVWDGGYTTFNPLKGAFQAACNEVIKAIRRRIGRESQSQVDDEGNEYDIPDEKAAASEYALDEENSEIKLKINQICREEAENIRRYLLSYNVAIDNINIKKQKDTRANGISRYLPFFFTELIARNIRSNKDVYVPNNNFPELNKNLMYGAYAKALYLCVKYEGNQSEIHSVCSMDFLNFFLRNAVENIHESLKASLKMLNEIDETQAETECGFRLKTIVYQKYFQKISGNDKLPPNSVISDRKSKFNACTMFSL